MTCSDEDIYYFWRSLGILTANYKLCKFEILILLIFEYSLKASKVRLNLKLVYYPKKKCHHGG